MASTITDAFKDATDKLQERAAALEDQAVYQVRKNAPRVERAVKAGYDEAAGALRSVASNRVAQGWIAAGAIAMLTGMLLLRRRS